MIEQFDSVQQKFLKLEREQQLLETRAQLQAKREDSATLDALIATLESREANLIGQLGEQL
jgi:hypothetical protein